MRRKRLVLVLQSTYRPSNQRTLFLRYIQITTMVLVAKVVSRQFFHKFLGFSSLRFFQRFQLKRWRIRLVWVDRIKWCQPVSGRKLLIQTYRRRTELILNSRSCPNLITTIILSSLTVNRDEWSFCVRTFQKRLCFMIIDFWRGWGGLTIF